MLSFSSFFVVGTFLQGNQPHPASRPPGVWYIRKLSPSPTLVTLPSRLFRRKYEGGMLAASGKRRRSRRTRSAARIEVVRIAVGIMVRKSTQSDQSVTLRQESQPLGGVVVDEVWMCCSSCCCGGVGGDGGGGRPSNSSGLSKGHGMTTHAFSVEGDEIQRVWPFQPRQIC